MAFSPSPALFMGGRAVSFAEGFGFADLRVRFRRFRTTEDQKQNRTQTPRTHFSRSGRESRLICRGSIFCKRSLGRKCADLVARKVTVAAGLDVWPGVLVFRGVAEIDGQGGAEHAAILLYGNDHDRVIELIVLLEPQETKLLSGRAPEKTQFATTNFDSMSPPI
jgi:hypothetical protein